MVGTRSWPELVSALTVEDPSRTVRGTVEASRDLRQGDGRRRVAARIWKSGPLLRRENLDGSLECIMGATTVWRWFEGSDLPVASARAGASWSINDDLGTLVEKKSIDFWTGAWSLSPERVPAIRPTTALGRPAWVIPAATPTGHRVSILVDAETGLELRTDVEDFGTVRQWLDIEVGVSLDDEIFEWSGDSRYE